MYFELPCAQNSDDFIQVSMYWSITTSETIMRKYFSQNLVFTNVYFGWVFATFVLNQSLVIIKVTGLHNGHGLRFIKHIVTILALWYFAHHYSDVTMGVLASQISGVSIACATICSGADQRNRQSFASLAFVGGIHRWHENPPVTYGKENFRLGRYIPVPPNFSSIKLSLKCKIWVQTSRTNLCHQIRKIQFSNL